MNWSKLRSIKSQLASGCAAALLSFSSSLLSLLWWQSGRGDMPTSSVPVPCFLGEPLAAHGPDYSRMNGCLMPVVHVCILLNLLLCIPCVVTT